MTELNDCPYIIRAISPSLRSRRRRANAGSPFSSPHFFLTFLPDLSFSPPPSPFSLLFLSFPHLSPPLFSPPLFSPHLAPPTGRLRHRRPARFPAVHPVLNSPAPTQTLDQYGLTPPCCRLNQCKATNSMVRWAEEMDAAGPKPRETGDAEAGILRMDGAAANGGQESQEAGTKADERLGQEAADGRQGRKTPAKGTGNGELKGSRTLTKGTENSELKEPKTPTKRTRNDELKEPGTPVVKGVKPTEAK